MNAPVVATVGTTHPLGFAGLTFAAAAIVSAGGRAACVVAGVSAQDGHTVTLLRPLDAAAISAQFAALDDADVRAFHVGALVSAESVAAVAAGLARYAGVPVVLDPVLAATGGGTLADGATRDALLANLVPHVSLVTPNLDEASALLGHAVACRADMLRAASALRALGAGAALVKGGHLAGDAVDVFASAEGVRTFVAPRIASAMRGTGDLLAATIATRLAHGDAVVVAIERARDVVRAALARAEDFAGTRVAPARL